MPLPKPVKNVPRDRVHEVVESMLWSEEVSDLFCSEQPDRKYTVVPRPRAPVAVTMRSSTATRKKASKKRTSKRTGKRSSKRKS